MSESVLLALIGCGTGLSFVLTCVIFVGSRSNFETLVDAWKEKRLAELEAEHALRCPRLTDNLRKP